jgi:hypothetical protein
MEMVVANQREGDRLEDWCREDFASLKERTE